MNNLYKKKKYPIKILNQEIIYTVYIDPGQSHRGVQSFIKNQLHPAESVCCHGHSYLVSLQKFTLLSLNLLVTSVKEVAVGLFFCQPGSTISTPPTIALD